MEGTFTRTVARVQEIVVRVAEYTRRLMATSPHPRLF
jgi:hypothetical protein